MQSPELTGLALKTAKDPRRLQNAAKNIGKPGAVVVAEDPQKKSELAKAAAKPSIGPTQKENKHLDGLKDRNLPPGYGVPDVVSQAEKVVAEYAAMRNREDTFAQLQAKITNGERYRAVLTKAGQPDQLSKSEQNLLTKAADEGVTIAQLDTWKAEQQALKSAHDTDEKTLREKGKLDAGEVTHDQKSWGLLEKTILEQQKKLAQAFESEVVVMDGTTEIRKKVKDALISNGLEPLDWRFKEQALKQLEKLFDEIGDRRISSVAIVGRVAAKGGKWISNTSAEDLAKAYADGEIAERSKGTEVHLGDETVLVTSDTLESKYKSVKDHVQEELRKALGADFTLTEAHEEQIRKQLGLIVVKDAAGTVQEYKAAANASIRNLLLWEEYQVQTTAKLNEDLGAVSGDQTLAEGTYWMAALKVEGDAVVTGLSAGVMQEAMAGAVKAEREIAAAAGDKARREKLDAWLANDGKEYTESLKGKEKAQYTIHKNWLAIKDILKKGHITKENAGKLLLLFLGLGLALVVLSGYVVIQGVGALGGGGRGH